MSEVEPRKGDFTAVAFGFVLIVGMIILLIILLKPWLGSGPADLIEYDWNMRKAKPVLDTIRE